MRYAELRAETMKLSSAVDRYIYSNALPAVWFDHGYDHVAIKAYSGQDYEGLLQEFKSVSEFITETSMDGRYIAMAHLIGNYGLRMALEAPGFTNNPVLDVELMLARPAEQTRDCPELDHAEIYMPRGLLPVRKVLANKNIQYVSQHNQSHSWVSVIINSEADELKFTDRCLSDVISEQIDSGVSHVIHGKFRSTGKL